jgi:hypothetical protein
MAIVKFPRRARFQGRMSAQLLDCLGLHICAKFVFMPCR